MSDGALSIAVAALQQIAQLGSEERDRVTARAALDCIDALGKPFACPRGHRHYEGSAFCTGVRRWPGSVGRARTGGVMGASAFPVGECHICHRPRNEPGELYCSAAHPLADFDAIRARAESVEITSTASDGTEIVYCGTPTWGEYVGWTTRENAEAKGYEVRRTKPNQDVLALLAECDRLRERDEQWQQQNLHLWQRVELAEQLAGRLREQLAETEAANESYAVEAKMAREQLDALADAVEQDAASRAYAADLGASEWRAFIAQPLWDAFLAARAALGVEGPAE